MTEASILIGMPSDRGWCHTRCTESIVASVDLMRVRGVGAGLTIVSGLDTASARNELVRRALCSDFSHLLMVDADQAWEPDAPLRLLAWGEDVVAGVAMSRHGGCYLIGEPVPVPGRPPLLACSAVSAGFLLLSRDCLLQMVLRHYGRPFAWEDGPLGGEDLVFCQRWIAMGGAVYADPEPRMYHYGEAELKTTLAEAIAARGAAECMAGAILTAEALGGG